MSSESETREVMCRFAILKHVKCYNSVSNIIQVVQTKKNVSKAVFRPRLAGLCQFEKYQLTLLS